MYDDNYKEIGLLYCVFDMIQDYCILFTWRRN